MATLGSSPESSPSPYRRRPRSWARRCERYCCNVVTYFPLAFVYSLTTWAVWVEAKIGFNAPEKSWVGLGTSVAGIALYVLLNLSYTIAVFTDPGSPLNSRSRSGRDGYSHLPTTESAQFSAVTVNSMGGSRYCKKCQSPKPDRTHHCSTCKRCVLKMDHHCPWLATCVGLHNYKAFLLFLIYTSIFCWVCFAVSSYWAWTEVLSDSKYMHTTMPVNVILLAVVAGVIGLVLTGFTGWHISLAMRGLTTIECLEKTRYLSPLRQSLDRHRQEGQRMDVSPYGNHGSGGLGETLHGYGQQIINAHANAIPGVTRAEEGEERTSPASRPRPSHIPYNQYGPHPDPTPAQQSLFRSYEEIERARQQRQYDEYLAEKEAEAMPNAWDLGWRRNLRHLFGEQPLLWLLPVCNTTGDGWRWEPGPKWLEAREQITQRRSQPTTPQTYGQEQARPIVDRSNAWSDRFDTGRGYSHRDGHYEDGQRPATGVSMQTLRPMSPRLHPEESEDEDGFGVPNGHRSGTEGDTASEERAPLNPDHGRKTQRQRKGDADDEWRDWD